MQPLIKYYRKRFINDLQKLLDVDLQECSFLIAVSGGADSMALATLAVAGLQKIAIAHCNFKLREESDAEKQMVKTYFESLNIPVYTSEFETKSYAGNHKLTIQEAARELRYTYFKELATQHQYTYILTAHHISDNTETFLLHLTRGSGLTGLGGIPEKNGNILRPLLSWKKTELLDWLELNEVPSMTDSSNYKVAYDRNYLRHEVLPAYRKRFGALDQSILKSSRIMREIDRYLQNRIQQEFQNALIIYPFGQIFHLQHITDLALLPLIIRIFLRRFNFSHEAIDDLLAAIHANKYGVKIVTSTGVNAIYSRNQISIVEGQLPEWNTDFPIVPGIVSVYQGSK